MWEFAAQCLLRKYPQLCESAEMIEGTKSLSLDQGHLINNADH